MVCYLKQLVNAILQIDFIDLYNCKIICESIQRVIFVFFVSLMFNEMHYPFYFKLQVVAWNFSVVHMHKAIRIPKTGI